MKIAKPLRQSIAVLMTLALAFCSFPGEARLQEEPGRKLLTMINEARLTEGLPPLSWSRLLLQAAQRHAEDMAENNTIDHVGSDNSTYQQRIRETGYRAWNEGLLVNEAIWAGLGTEKDAFNWFRNDPEQWDLFVDPRYREVGIGYSEDDQGVHYFVLNFGVRPGVLPVFINDGADTTDSSQIAVRLTNEDAVPLGDGNWIGKAIEVRLSNTPEFENTSWQPWELLLPWRIENTTPGDYAVYVQFRDGAGRTAIAEDTIRLVTSGEALPDENIDEEETAAAPPALTSTPPETQPATVTPSEETESITPEATLLPTQETSQPMPIASETPLPPASTWTPASNLNASREPTAVDWPLIAVFLLQGIAGLLGFALFLKRR